MLLIILITYYLLHTLLFKAPKGALYCGLFGGSFNRQIADDIIWKLKVLGFFNQSRGEHSCGVYNGDQLVKGVAENKKFIDFAINVGIKPGNGENNVFIGHTRYATIGDHTADNAHPFNIQDKMIFAHNGKIEDMWHEDRLETVWTALRRSGTDPIGVKVDSQALGHMVVNLGFKVLEKYKGFAALLMHRLSEPNTLYVYHGASKNYRTGDLMEERPMFFMKTPEGVYFSSMEESLKFIRNPETDEVPMKLIHNRVVKLRNGEFVGKSLIITREEANCSPVWTGYPQNYNNYTAGYNSPKAPTTTTKTSDAAGAGGKTTTFTTDTVEIGKNTLDINTETVPLAAFGEEGRKRIFYWRNRYYMPDNKVCHGVVVVDKSGNVMPQVSMDDSLSKTTTMYFWQGVYLRDKKAYDLIERAVADPTSGLGKHLTNPVFNFAKYISKLAKYPVTNMGDESKDVGTGRDVFYLGGCPVKSESFTPVFSNRNYHFRNGALVVVRHDVNRGNGGNPDEKFFLSGSPQSTDQQDRLSNIVKSAIKGSGGIRISANNGSCSSKSAAGAGCGSGDDAGSADADCGSSVPRHPDVAYIRRSFEKVFTSVEDAEAEFSGYNYVALKLFVYDVLEKILHQFEPEEEIVEALVHDLYEQAVQQGVTLEEILEKGVEDIDFYIVEVLKDEATLMLESEDDEDDNEHIIDFAISQEAVDRQRMNKKKEGGDAVVQANLFPAKIIPLITNPTKEEEDMNALNQQQLRMEQDEEAREIVAQAVTLLEGIRKVTARLNPLEASHFAEEAARSILLSLDSLKGDLQSLAQKHGHGELALQIKQTMSAHADIGHSTL